MVDLSRETAVSKLISKSHVTEVRPGDSGRGLGSPSKEHGELHGLRPRALKTMVLVSFQSDVLAE
jgi:hypothetical protein